MRVNGMVWYQRVFLHICCGYFLVMRKMSLRHVFILLANSFPCSFTFCQMTATWRHFGLARLSWFVKIQQDRAPARGTREAVELLRQSARLIIAPHRWPPNSTYWTQLIFRYMRPCGNVFTIYTDRHLQRWWSEISADQFWYNVDQKVIDTAIDQCCKRLRASVCTVNGHTVRTRS